MQKYTILELTITTSLIIKVVNSKRQSYATKRHQWTLDEGKQWMIILIISKWHLIVIINRGKSYNTVIYNKVVHVKISRFPMCPCECAGPVSRYLVQMVEMAARVGQNVRIVRSCPDRSSWPQTQRILTTVTRAALSPQLTSYNLCNRRRDPHSEQLTKDQGKRWFSKPRLNICNA